LFQFAEASGMDVNVKPFDRARGWGGHRPGLPARHARRQITGSGPKSGSGDHRPEHAGENEFAENDGPVEPDSLIRLLVSARMGSGPVTNSGHRPVTV
jgi:hypothetical protein